MQKALKRLEEQFPAMKHTEYQDDDIYFIDGPPEVDDLFGKITERWGQ